MTAGQDGTARIWDVETERQLAVLKGHHDWITSVAFTADGETIVTAGDDGTVRRGCGTPARAPRARSCARVRDRSGPLAVEPRRKSAHPLGELRRWTGRRCGSGIPSTGRALHRLPLAGGAALPAAFTADGRRVATGS